ncbi:MAG: polysaccharide biosynthesis tyrosine autokinase [Lewinellaceae bacterium]|nr:polysaccharide biosynthesis tyrosine autokinase [Lewinellaceae bacterium]
MEEGTIDIMLLLRKAIKYWFLFVAGAVIAFAMAVAYLKYKEPSYQGSTMILVEDDKGSSQITEEAIFKDLGLVQGSSNLINEMSILKSTPLLKNVVEQLELQYRYFRIDGLITRELYKNSPIEILNWEPDEAYGGFYGILTADQKGGYRLEVDDEELGDDNVFFSEFGKSLKLPMGAVTLANRDNIKDFGEIGVLVLPVSAMVDDLSSKISVALADEKSSMIHISMKDVSPQRIEDVLDALVETYNQNSIEQKNLVFKNTIDLINNRIDMIIEELTAAEQDVENYKQRFSMTELSSEGTLLMNEMASYNKEITGKQLQLDIMNSIEEFLDKNRDNFEFVPTNVSITNLTLTTQLESFNRLLEQRGRMRTDLGPAHPDLLLIEKQIRNLRETIIENIQSIKGDLELALNSNKGVKNNLQARLQTLPRRERELVEIERRKSVKENLYLYLLQKREESAISLAVTSAKSQVIEPASAPPWPVSPNRKQIMVVAIFLGLAIPAGIVFLINFLNDKIQVEDDLEGAASVPVAGLIGQSRRKGRLVVRENSRSVTAEMFRMLRANLNYFATGADLKVMLITSGVSGEGKSFIALNLGAIQALTGKKVVILELDLRRPKQEVFGTENPSLKGVVDYLIDPTLPVGEIIQNSGAHPNLDLIQCGPKPPNPSELILSSRLRELVNLLRLHYDFIILDTPPVGIVADALQMSDLADASMFVLRAGYSRRPELRLINDLSEKKKLPRPFIVLNSVPIKNSGYNYNFSYAYGYSYGQEAGYYDDGHESGKWWKKWAKIARLNGNGHGKGHSRNSTIPAEANGNGNGKHVIEKEKSVKKSTGEKPEEQQIEHL